MASTATASPRYINQIPPKPSDSVPDSIRRATITVWPAGHGGYRGIRMMPMVLEPLVSGSKLPCRASKTGRYLPVGMRRTDYRLRNKGRRKNHKARIEGRKSTRYGYSVCPCTTTFLSLSPNAGGNISIFFQAACAILTTELQSVLLAASRAAIE